MIPKLSLSPTYQELVRRAGPLQIEDVDRREIDSIISEISQGNLSHPLIKDSDAMAKKALSAVRQEFISIEDLATILLVRMALQYEGVRFIPLFEGDEPSAQALELMDEMRFGKRRSPKFMPTVLMDEKGRDEWFSRMKKQAPLHRFFLVFDDKEFIPIDQTTKPDAKIHTVSQVIIMNPGIPLFNRVLSKRYRIVPSFAAMQTALDVIFGPRRAKINPAIGFSSISDIENNGLFDSRDMVLDFPGVELPKLADNFIASPLDLTQHDFYHSFVVSTIDPNIRYASIFFSQIIKTFRYEEAFLQNIAEMIIERLIDLESNDFRKDLLNRGYPFTEPKALFWIVLSDYWLAGLRKFSPTEKVSQSQKVLFDLVKFLRQDRTWEREFGLDMEDIIRLQCHFENDQYRYPIYHVFKSLKAACLEEGDASFEAFIKRYHEIKNS